MEQTGSVPIGKTRGDLELGAFPAAIKAVE